MPSFNPSTVLVTLDDRPIKSGRVEDASKRAVLVGMMTAVASASDKDKPALQEALETASEDAQPTLTVGRAVMDSLAGSPLPGDESLSAAQKLDHMTWAVKVKAALAAGESVTFTNAETDAIKERVNKMYPAAIVVAQVFGAIKPDEAA